MAPLGWLALEAGLVVLAALAVQPLLRTAAARRSLWRAALLAMLAVLAAELTGTGSQLPAQLRLAWQTTFPAPAPPPPAPAPFIPALSEPLPISDLPSPIPLEAFPAPEPLQLEPVPSLPPPPRPLSPPPTFPPALLVWLAGLAALLARAAWIHAGFAWLRFRHFLPAAESLCQRVQSLAARLGLRRRVRVLASERLRAPAAFGWVRPGVALPGDFTARFAPAQQDVMLAHELAHLAARDPLWQLLADLAVAALWWHPLAWVARRQHRLAAELAADDASQALPDGPVVLAECLLALGHEAAAAPRAPLGMAGFRSQLGRRVERLVALPRGDWQAPSRLRLALQTTTALLALAALALLPGCAANRAASEAPSSLVTKWWQAKKDNSAAIAEAEVTRRKYLATIAELERKRVAQDEQLRREGKSLKDAGPGTILYDLMIDDIRKRLASLPTAASDAPLVAADVRRLQSNTERGGRNAESSQSLVTSAATNTQPVVIQGRVSFNGTPPPERDIPLPPPVLAVRTNAPLQTRFHRVSPDGGLADVVVYVKAGLPKQTYPVPDDEFVVRAVHYEFQPYVGAVHAGQRIRWESIGTPATSVHPAPTNTANPEFSRALMQYHPFASTFPAPEHFLRVKVDVFPWMMHYVSVFEHPYFAVTDAEGRFRFPQPLPPGKYTLAAVHRQAGEVAQELDLTVSKPAEEVSFALSPKPVAAYVVAVGDEVRMEVYQRDNLRTQTKVQPDGTLPLPLIGAVKAAGQTISELRNAIRDAYEAAHFRPAHITVTLVQSAPPLAPPPLLSTPKRAPDFTPSKPPTREELLERKARVEAEIKTLEKVFLPTHPKMVGLRKQLETVEEALRQQARMSFDLAVVSFSLKQVEQVERRLQNPVHTTGERLQFYATVDYGALRYVPVADRQASGQRPTNGAVIIRGAPSTATADWAELELQKQRLERTIKEQAQTYAPTHPKMQTLRKQLEAFSRLLEEEERKAAAKFNFLKRTLEQQQRELLQKRDAAVPALPSAPPAAVPKPGATNPVPSPPVAADVRSLTPTRSTEGGTRKTESNQSLVTSAATPVQLAAASPKDIRLPVPNPYHRTNSQAPFLTHSSKGAQRINRKLEEIVLPEVHFDAVPLVGVVQRLIEDAKKFDPEKKGLNFLINDVSPAAPLLDAAGNPVPVARPVALSEGLVRVPQPLKGLTLRQALDVICKSAELPTQFSVEEYAIAFIPRGPVAYYSRMFRVSPDAFIQGLQGVVGNPVLGVVGQASSPAPAAPVRATVPATVPATPTRATDANALVRQYFQSAGVTALGATNGSTRVTFNPENGLLLVRGTTNDLRLIEQAIQKVQPGAK